MRRWISVILVLGLTGCMTLGGWTQLKGNEYKDWAGKFKAMVPKDWMRLNAVNYFMITKDGLKLDYIAVKRFRFKDKLEKTKKQFSQDMTPPELAEVEIDNNKADDTIQNFKLIDNKPITIAGQPGFCLEYNYSTADGLPMKGIHYGFLNKEWVYRIRYEATTQHYFEKYKQDFEKFIQSFQLI